MNFVPAVAYHSGALYRYRRSEAYRLTTMEVILNATRIFSRPERRLGVTQKPPRHSVILSPPLRLCEPAVPTVESAATRSLARASIIFRFVDDILPAIPPNDSTRCLTHSSLDRDRVTIVGGSTVLGESLERVASRLIKNSLD